MLHALGLALMTAAIAPQQAASVPLDSSWELSGDGSRIEQYQGRRAIRLRSGRGDNEVLLLVSDVFGGWGLTARLDPAGPARLVSARP